MKRSATSSDNSSREGRARWDRRILGVSIGTLALAIGAVLWLGINNTSRETLGHFPVVTTSRSTTYPLGSLDDANPSGMAPPGPDALAGYHRSYVNDFTGSTTPPGWYLFSGVPSGDPSGQFDARHVVFANGMLQLNTWKDPRYSNKWVTGGLCQCGLHQTYGAYFVRSRISRAGPNEVQLLWPTSNNWPPEIDFNETGDSVRSSSWTVHWGVVNHIVQQSIFIDMRRWHTWGVIWSRTSIIFTVDGRQWGDFRTVANIPKEPMSLHFEQLASCANSRYCPRAPATMQIDWVAEYTRNAWHS